MRERGGLYLWSDDEVLRSMPQSLHHATREVEE